MKSIIEKTIAALMLVCATSGAWAEVLTYGSTGASGDGYYISNNSASPTTVFTNLSLRDMITKYKISGYIGGGWIPEGEVDGVYNAVVGKDTLTVQFQKADGESVKGTIVNFRQSGANITAYAVKYSYKTYSDSATATASLGVDLTATSTGSGTAPTSDIADGYGIYGITLTSLAAGESPIAVRTGSKPLSVWNGDFPVGTTDSRGGYTLYLNGNDSNGSVITIKNSANSSEGGVYVGDNGVGNYKNVNVIAGITVSSSDLSSALSSNPFLFSSAEQRKNGTDGTYHNNLNGLFIGSSDRKIYGSWKGGTSGGGNQNNATYPTDGVLHSVAICRATSNDADQGTKGFVDGNCVMAGSSYANRDDDRNNLGISICGQIGNSNYNLVGATINYIAVFAQTSEKFSSDLSTDMIAWSLNDMTSAESFSDGGTISATTDYSSTGINLNGGTVTLSGDVTAAAIFVQSSTTLSFANGATLTVGGDGLGPIYIAEGATLTIDASSCSPAGNAAEDLVKGVFYGKSQVVVKTPTTFGYSLSDIGVQIGKYLRWNYADSARILTWKTPSTVTTTNFRVEGTAYTVFDIFAVADGDSVSDGRSSSSSMANFNCFAYSSSTAAGFDKTKYAAPGTVIRFTSGDDYVKTINGTDFGPFTLGGLIVEGDASGYSFGSDSRTTLLGDPTGGETWFEINNSFAINRSGECAILGVVNIAVANNAVFTYGGNTWIGARGDAANGGVPARVAGGTLKMHGEGKMTVSSLDASNATLDYSDLAPNRGAAFIDGALSINSSTQIKFPASTVWPYKVASSISGLTDGYTTLAAANYTVGGVAGTNDLLLFANGTAIPEDEQSATISTADTYTLAGLFSSASSVAGNYTIYVNESATLNIPSDTTVFKVNFEVANGKTLTLTGSTLTATGGITITGNGKVATTVAAQLAGVVKGDGTIEYAGVVPTTTGTDIVFTGAAWTGTVSIKNYNDGTSRALNVNYWCNEGSKLKFTNVKGHVPGISNTGAWQLGYDGSTLGELILEDDGDKVAFDRADGWSHDATHNSYCMFAKLSGSGTLEDSKNQTIYLVFKDATGFSGVINVLNGTSVIIGDSSPTGTTYDRMIVVDSGKSATIANGKTWHAGYCGVYISGTLKFVGTGEASSAVGPVATANGSTLDFSEATSDTRISGALTLASGTTIKLPAGVDLSTGYQVASSGGSGFINATVQIDGGSTITENIRFDSGTIYVVSPVEIDDDAKVYTVSEVFGTPTATSDYVINVKATATMTVPGTEVRTVTYNFTADGNTITLAEGYKVPATTTNLKITDASSLTAGNYTLFQWTTPQQNISGYGRFASVDTTGLNASLTAEVVYGAKAIYLRVYDKTAFDARPAFKVWAYGDSITEGWNSSSTRANYRVLLAQKLAMRGYNVEMVGCFGQIQLGNDSNSAKGAAFDPSGEEAPDKWQWHSAKHGATLGITSVTSYQRAALIENVDTLCAQVDTPDVVLLHGGINDLSVDGVTEQATFDNWSNTVWRILTDLPNTKVVVSTALFAKEGQANYNRVTPKVPVFNNLIKQQLGLVDGFTPERPFPTGRVVLADLNTCVHSADTGILTSDNLHPDWWGHDQMAEGWLEKIVELYPNPSGTFPSATVKTAPTSDQLGAANKTELASYRAGFTRYGVIEVGNNKSIDTVAYTDVDANAASEGLTKVGYFVEYVRDDNNEHRWVWVDMDAFGSNIADIGLPTANHQQEVTKLHVKSNHPGIENVDADDDSVTGWVEFTPFDYTGDSSGVTGAPLRHGAATGTYTMYDWDDTLFTSAENVDSGNNACMQVFRKSPATGRPAQTIFAFNNWRSTSGEAEFGIGNFAQHFWGGQQTFDYTFTRGLAQMNASAYKVKTIEIWTKPVYTATVAADADFSVVAASAGLPVDASACDLVINVTADATLTFDDTTSVGSITFNIAENKTLTLDGVTNLTVGKVVVSGPGKIAFTASPAFGALRIASNATITLTTGQSITLTGALTVESGVTLTMEPASIAALTGTMISAGSVVNNGTVALTAPDSGSDYSVSITGTAVTLRRVTKNAFAYNPVPGDNTPSGWITSWGGNAFATTSLRVGPTSAIPYVYHVSDNAHPYYNLSPRNDTSNHKVSCAVYANVSQMASSGKQVIASFGNQGYSLIMYREGDAVKVGRVRNYNFVSGTDGDASITIPSDNGYHLWTFTCEFKSGSDTSDKTIALYLDDGVGVGKSSSNTAIAHDAVNLNGGFSIGSVYDGVPTGFSVGVGLAVCAVRGYDVVLQPEEVETLSESFPATDGNVTWNVEPDNADNTVIVTSTTFGDSNYIGQSKGTLTIPEGSTVNVKHIRVLNNGSTSDRATVNIAGTLNITSESTNPNTWADRLNNKGVLFGHYHGQATYNITGSLLAENTYIEVAYTAEDQLLDIDGGTVKTKALYAQYANGTHTVKLRNGGTLEVSEILSSGESLTKEFKYGTFRVMADATETRAINFSAAGGYATTLDPHGNTLTLQSAALTGSGDITVADSSVSGDGKVVFVDGSNYNGRLILTDANAANIDISGYAGTVLCQGTAAATIAKFNEFAGTVYFTGNVDATGVDLSGATVNIADNCTFTADAGKEGSLVVGSGVSVELHVDNSTVNYEGHYPVISGSCTVTYYNTDTSSIVANTESDTYTIGNNLLPYFNVWTASATPSENTLSANAAARWKCGSLPAANKNVAFKLNGDATVTIDATITFKDVQVYGTGSLTIQQSGDNVLTVGKGLYTTANVSVQIDSGLAFASGTKLEVESALASMKYVAINCGTAGSPFEIPAIYGSGMVYVTTGKALTTASCDMNTLMVDGTVTLTGASSISSVTVASGGVLNVNAATTATTLTVNAGGVVNVAAGVTLTAPTLAVNGTVNMTSTSTLSGTTSLSGVGTVNWNGKNPDLTVWKDCSTWCGTNVVSSLSDDENRKIQNWGRYSNDSSQSFIKLIDVRGWTDANVVINPEVILENGSAGYGLEISNGSTTDDPTYFAKLSGSGTLKQTGSGGNQRYVLRDVSDFTGSIEKTDTVRVLIIDATTTQGNLPAKSNQGHMFVANITAKIGDGNGWSVESTKNLDIAGTATVEMLGAASMSGPVTFHNGATLKFDNIGTSVSPKKLTLSSTLTFASGTVNIAFDSSAASALYDGATLIDWTANGSAPAGLFAFSDSSLSANWVLFKEATGLKVYTAHINDNAETPAEAGTISMESDGSLKATVRPTGAAVTLPERITKLEVSVTANAFGTLTAPGVITTDNVVVKYGETDITGAFTIGISAGAITLALDPDGEVTFNEGGADEKTVSVKPAVDTSDDPMTMPDETTAPAFNIKTIPGLWYVVKSGTSPSSLTAGAATQATTTTTKLDGATMGDATVKYYKISVGTTAAEAQQ